MSACQLSIPNYLILIVSCCVENWGGGGSKPLDFPGRWEVEGDVQQRCEDGARAPRRGAGHSASSPPLCRERTAPRPAASGGSSSPGAAKRLIF